MGNTYALQQQPQPSTVPSVFGTTAMTPCVRSSVVSAGVLGPLLLAASVALNAVYIPMLIQTITSPTADDDTTAYNRRTLAVLVALMAASAACITVPVFNVVLAAVFAATMEYDRRHVRSV